MIFDPNTTHLKMLLLSILSIKSYLTTIN